MSSPDTATATAPGKLILIGEHAVVYGYGAIALPMPTLGVRAQVEPTQGPLRLECALWRGELGVEIPETLKGLACAVFAALRRLKAPENGLVLTIESNLPIGCGLGSSAASVVALIRALYAAFGQEASLSDVLALAYQAEAVSHGLASGLDAETVARATPLWFKRHQPPVALEFPEPLSLVVADSGKGRRTRAAISCVKEALEHSLDARSSLARLGSLAEEARLALMQGELRTLGMALSEAHEHLGGLGVSSPMLDTLVEAALQAGALGAKLTGAGQGGCMLALASGLESAEAIAQTLLAHGACKAWVIPLEGSP